MVKWLGHISLVIDQSVIRSGCCLKQETLPSLYCPVLVSSRHYFKRILQSDPNFKGPYVKEATKIHVI